MADFEITLAYWPIDFLQKEWELAWGEKIPDRRKSLKSWYPVNIYIIAIHNDNNYEPEDKGKPVGYLGYTDLGEYALYGDAHTYSKYAKKGVYGDLVRDRDKKVPAPKFAGFRPKKQSLESYLIWQRSLGFIVNPTDEEISTHFGALPEKVVDKFRSFYEGDSGASWGIKKHMDSFGKAWLMLLKDFEPAGE